MATKNRPLTRPELEKALNGFLIQGYPEFLNQITAINQRSENVEALDGSSSSKERKLGYYRRKGQRY